MPFGLCNAAAIFQRELVGLFPMHCIIFSDNIVAFGRDIREHSANLKLVLNCLRDAGFVLNTKKYRFSQRSVNFPRYAVPSDWVTVIEDRIRQVRTRPTPTSQTELHSFFGLAKYYRRFVKGSAKIASPLHKLIEKQAKKNFKWENEHDKEFKEIRQTLCSTPILALLNFKAGAPPFALSTDASGAAVSEGGHVILMFLQMNFWAGGRETT
ncbi:Retrovirus-related Pol polyprotein from transposon opu [Taenia solium]|eukprot:TsM_001199600 transcript=TsM_001199600 gene=TsM_001199600